jgi:hypothetical protein
MTVSWSGVGGSVIQFLRLSWNSLNSGTVGRGFWIPSWICGKITKVAVSASRQEA